MSKENIKEIEISVSTEVGDNPSDKIAIGRRKYAKENICRADWRIAESC